LSAISDTQIELHTDRNQSLAEVDGALEAVGDQRVLSGVVTLDYRTTDRVVVLNLPRGAQCEFRLRVAADPSHSEQFGPWHLTDHVELANGLAEASAHDAYATAIACNKSSYISDITT